MAYPSASIGRTLTRGQCPQPFSLRVCTVFGVGGTHVRHVFDSQRATWINIAREVPETPAWVLVFDTPFEVRGGYSLAPYGSLLRDLIIHLGVRIAPCRTFVYSRRYARRYDVLY